MTNKHLKLEDIPEVIRNGKIKGVLLNFEEGTFEIKGRLDTVEKPQEKQLLNEITNLG